MIWRIYEGDHDFGRDYERWQAVIVIARYRKLHPHRRYRMVRKR